MDAPAEPYACVPLGGGQAVLRLRCLRGFIAEGGITAHLAGMACGHLPQEGAVAAGTELALPLHRLPRVDLPAALRFSTAAGEREVAAPFTLASAAAATQLFGPGLWQAQELRVAQGLLHGLLLNADNALAEPLAFARLNGTVSRPVVLGRPAATAEGAALWPFQLPLLAEDLLDSGLGLTLHVAGQDAPLASLAWSRAWAGEQDRRLVELEARLQDMERGAGARLTLLAQEQARLHAEQGERIDAFIEYAGALLLDRLAGTASTASGGDPGLAALRAVIAAAGQIAVVPPAPAAVLPLAGESLVVPPSAGHFSFGWHQLERDQGGEFRWMTQAGVVANPQPHRPVAGVVVEIRHLYGVARPAVQAKLDSHATEVLVEGEAPANFRLRITPGAGPLACQVLRLESLHGGSPARDGASLDGRVLSIAVARVVFDYAD